MLIIIPRMFCEKELEDIIGTVPDDFEEKSKEFWTRVTENLKPLTSRVKKVYYGSLPKGGDEGLALLESGELPGYEPVGMLLEAGAELQVTEDPVLVQESFTILSWMQMGKGTAQEMLRSNMKERDRYVAQVISETLSDGELGVLFLEPYRNLNLPRDIRVFRICPLDPRNYVEVWKARLKRKGA